jgi:xyloglucan-specific exo-beta-1,4-glucanase
MLKRTLTLLFCVVQVAAFSQQWKSLGPVGSATYGNHVASQGGTGQVHAITFDPDSPAIVYCASPFGGLWKSVDSGNNWSAADIDVNQSLELCSVSDIAIAGHGSKKTLWISTGHPNSKGGGITFIEPYSSGIYKSDDGGYTFLPVPSFNDKFHFKLQSRKHISRIVAHPQNPAILFVATSDGLYQTRDGGKHWKLVLTEQELPGNNPTTQGIFTVEFSRINPDKIVYAAGVDLYQSVTGGKKGSFKSMTHNTEDFFGQSARCLNNLNLNVDVNLDTVTNKDVLYAVAFIKGDTCGNYRNSSTYELHYYNGIAWSKVPGPPITPFIDPARIKVASVPNSPNIVYTGVTVTYVSSDYGTTWAQATDYNQPGHADIHAIEIVPGTCDMLTGTDGGVFRYRYKTKKVEECNNGLSISPIVDMGASATNPDRILVGILDMGADLWDGKEWTKLPSGGDGYWGQYIDYSNDWNFFSCHNFSFLKNEAVGRFNLQLVNSCIMPYGACPTAFTQDPSRPNIFYSAEREIFKSIDTGRSWCRISDFRNARNTYINPEGQRISCLEVAPSNPDIIYAGFNALENCCNSSLFRNDKGGMPCNGVCNQPIQDDSWKRIEIPAIETANGSEDFTANSYHTLSSIAISDKDPDKVWISFSYSNNKNKSLKVFGSTDGGKTWTPDDAGLPEYPVNKVIYINGSNDALFAATCQGVYYKKSGEAWMKFGAGLPHVYINDLEINYISRKLRIATYGRGVWEIDLPHL